ncbi:CDP-alcohol phosphatidyltransferase family protein [Actinoplanes sp. GCM10030250]|uniref:CDP-alcohol phosphatidyltransferase family protein n=1 Tax=Actinoplanes sp. GCM10030250 TaxID=3273376 RepID=UPI00362063E2
MPSPTDPRPTSRMDSAPPPNPRATSRMDSAPSAAAGSAPGSGNPAGGTPGASDYYAVNRGGGLFSEGVSQRIGARIAVRAHRHHLTPTVLTIFNLGLGCLVSFVVIATAGPVADGNVWAAPVGLLALIGWQLAYAFDCSDGQLARVTGQSSPAGARLDVLCDVAVQSSLVAALAATAKAQEPDTPAWLLAAFAATWMVNLVTSVMQGGDQAASMVTSQSLPIRAVKLIRDYGAVITLAGVVLTVAPQWTVWFVALFTLVNGGFLAASIAFAGRAALRG